MADYVLTMTPSKITGNPVAILTDPSQRALRHPEQDREIALLSSYAIELGLMAAVLDVFARRGDRVLRVDEKGLKSYLVGSLDDLDATGGVR